MTTELWISDSVFWEKIRNNGTIKEKRPPVDVDKVSLFSTSHYFYPQSRHPLVRISIFMSTMETTVASSSMDLDLGVSAVAFAILVGASFLGAGGTKNQNPNSVQQHHKHHHQHHGANTSSSDGSDGTADETEAWESSSSNSSASGNCSSSSSSLQLVVTTASDVDTSNKNRVDTRRRSSSKALSHIHETLGKGRSAKKQVFQMRQRHFSQRLSVSYANTDPLMLVEVNTKPQQSLWLPLSGVSILTCISILFHARPKEHA